MLIDVKLEGAPFLADGESAATSYYSTCSCCAVNQPLVTLGFCQTCQAAVPALQTMQHC